MKATDFAAVGDALPKPESSEGEGERRGERFTPYDQVPWAAVGNQCWLPSLVLGLAVAEGTRCNLEGCRSVARTEVVPD